MQEQEKSPSALRDEIRALRAELAERDDALQAAEARAESYRALLTQQSDAAFHLAVQPDGTVDAVDVDATAVVSDRDVTRVVTRAPGPSHCRRVVQTGRPTSYRSTAVPDATENAPWMVHLAPADGHADSAPNDAAPNDAAPNDAAPNDAAPNDAAPNDAAPAPSNLDPSTAGVLDANGHRVHGVLHTNGASAPSGALAESRDLQRELVELLPDAILILGSDDTILFANSAACRMTGTASEEVLVGTSFWTYVPDDSHAQMRERKSRLRRGTAVDFAEMTLQREDGDTLPVETASVPIVYRGERAALTAVRDLTGRRRLTDTLQRTLNLFDKAFHLGPAALLIVRLRDGLILEASDRVTELSGYETADLVGQTLADLEAGIDDAERLALGHRLATSGRLRDEEVTLRRACGEPRAVLCSARVMDVDDQACALISLVDITQRKKAAASEREHRALLRKIFRASPAPIGICRLDDGQYLDANEALTSLLGHSHDEVVGATPDDLDLWVDPERRAELNRRLRDEPAVYDFQARFRTAGGVEVTTLASFQRIQVDGEACVLVVMTDITNREAARQALIEAKEKAEEAQQKAEEVAHFRSAVLSNMTHEVRTPLTVILGFTSMLREGVEDEYQRFVTLIERSGRRLLLTLDSLLDLAQIESGTLEMSLERQSVPETIHGITSSFASLAEEKGLTFSLDLPQEAVFAELDRDLFGRVLNHLVDNAVKFTGEGTVTVRVRPAGDAVKVQVEDTGAGIDAAFLPRIFDAFSQESEGLTRSHQGSGLGLTVCKRIVEELHGTISIDSEKGEGTIVTISLPRAK